MLPWAAQGFVHKPTIRPDAILHCQKLRQQLPTTNSPQQLHPVSLPPEPWQKLGLDTVGPSDYGASDCHFTISLVDYHSKWPEVTSSQFSVGREIHSAL